MSDQPPISTGVEACYRHPAVQTGVHCTRCGKPICPDCMVEAPVGFQCPDCVAEARKAFKESGAGPQTIRSQEGTPVTYALIAAIAGMFVLQIATGGGDIMSGGGNTLNLGTQVPLLVAQGQSWRLLSAVFLHGGIIHLALNGYGLFLFGSFVERTFGHVQVLVMFIVTGFFASATSYLFATQDMWLVQHLGASGAVFGLGGMYIAWAFARRNTQYGRAMLQQGMVWLLLNAVIGFSASGIDWRAHFGGVVAGFVGGFLIERFEGKMHRTAVLSLVAVALVAAGVAMTAYKTAEINEVVTSAASLSTLFGIPTG